MRYQIFLAGVLLVGALFLTGCMSIGDEFNYQSVNALVLGEKPDADYEIMFGKPQTVRSRKDPDGEFKQVTFAYGVYYDGIRVLTLEYRNETLNAYYYFSNFDGERSQIGAASFERVEIGQTKEEVEQLLGKPNGQALCPCYLKLFEEHCEFGSEIWTWNSVYKTGDSDKSSEAVSMFVIFDKEGAVVNTLQQQTAVGG